MGYLGAIRLTLDPIVPGGLTELAGGDVLFAMPCTSEKGYTDVLVEVSTPGGHSSVPPKHTVRISVSHDL